MQNYEKFQNSAKETTSFSNSEFSNHFQEQLSQVDGVALLDKRPLLKVSQTRNMGSSDDDCLSCHCISGRHLRSASTPQLVVGASFYALHARQHLAVGHARFCCELVREPCFF